MIKRYLQPIVEESLKQGLISVIYGARQTGKTTLSLEIAKKYPGFIYLNCDEPDVRLSLTNQNSVNLKRLIGDTSLVIIDEAQRVENIGLTAKLIYDGKLTQNLILTGSSSIDLANKVKEPLTGRASEHILYPLSLKELTTNNSQMFSKLNDYLIHGGYPAIQQLSSNDAITRLKTLAGQYIYKDVFNFNTKLNEDLVSRLLQLLALQIGSEVSYANLANKLDVSKGTVERYIDLLKKAFIIYRFAQFRKNQRNEIGRLRKVYFYDLGIRNALVDNFKQLELRDDSGALWENFIINERRKMHQKNLSIVKQMYWRSRSKQEIDLVEVSNQNISAFELKFSTTKILKIPSEFKTSYNINNLEIINNKNFVDYI